MVNYIDRDQMRLDILKARLMKPDVLIACMHWGVEYQSLPRTEERALGDWLLKMGVDHVIGSHPHVIQPVEVREDSLSPARHLIAYSLGNFVSNMSSSQTDGGMVVRYCSVGWKGENPLWRLCLCFSLDFPSGLRGKRIFRHIRPEWMKTKLHMSETTAHEGRISGRVRKLLGKYCKGIEEIFF